MSISNYKSFLDDYKLMEGLREMKFVLSKRFREQLSKINHVISDELLKLHNDLDSMRNKHLLIFVRIKMISYLLFKQIRQVSY